MREGKGEERKRLREGKGEERKRFREVALGNPKMHSNWDTRDSGEYTKTCLLLKYTYIVAI